MFGLKNASQTFQRKINDVLRGLSAFPYIDDILIASDSISQHLQDLQLVFQRLKDHGLLINLEKCIFAVSSITFLGYEISAQGSRPLQDRVQAVFDYEQPQTLFILRRFIGMVSAYCRCIKDDATLLAPLHHLLLGAKKKDMRPVPWSDAALSAFHQCKEALANAALLAHPCSGAQLRIFSDASNTRAEAVLEQLVQDQGQPLGFFSKSFSPTQQGYSAYDRELTALFLSIKHFRGMIEGYPLTLRTDQKLLLSAFKQKMDNASPRQLRQLNFIAQFSTDIQHIAGASNVVADSLSDRRACAELRRCQSKLQRSCTRVCLQNGSPPQVDALRLSTMLDFAELSQAQARDQELQHVLTSAITSLKLRKLTLGPENLEIYCDVSQNDIRPYVPETFRRQVFDLTHSLSHPSGRATTKIISQRYVWPSMSKDITRWASACEHYQRSKIGRHVHLQLKTFLNPDQRFDHIHINLVGPLPPFQGYTYLLTLVDRFTRWPEAIPLKNITAANVATHFYSSWIARFGYPKFITTDRGLQFESALFNALAQLLGGKRIRTMPYHPAPNGILERWHRVLKTALRCHDSQDWLEKLPTVLLGLRSVYKEDLKASPAEYLYGSILRLPGEFFIDEQHPEDHAFFLAPFKSHMQQLRPVSTSHHCKQNIFVYKSFYILSHVYLRNHAKKHTLNQAYSGPHKVIQRIDDRVFQIDINGRSANVSVENLKPAFLFCEELLATPPAATLDSGGSSSPVTLQAPSHRPSQQGSASTTETERPTLSPAAPQPSPTRQQTLLSHHNAVSPQATQQQQHTTSVAPPADRKTKFVPSILKKKTSTNISAVQGPIKHVRFNLKRRLL
ncbi:PREDICTED: uncharacterized protein K02A2.6-like isoform X2 [Dinoponera quadriceps]|uniref:RNA-directed DNA polymerase n=1 Tax=Dinoponera quadriceps TaxID=609295 RepID=A0A6P3X7B0_DINQU|nr:PREDICTED: uncharacterized protein K02A2.6-like isoform X1 [Dinoponera quadriceps]XP_014474131.1 PREDICTED: uncharacterized protein K02A2.6-like isoform X2 [Dinoponera quadriceps]